jgi:hypothetical protein
MPNIAGSNEALKAWPNLLEGDPLMAVKILAVPERWMAWPFSSITGRSDEKEGRKQTCGKMSYNAGSMGLGGNV